MATLEINLLDLNDNRPRLTALYNKECSKLIDASYYASGELAQNLNINISVEMFPNNNNNNNPDTNNNNYDNYEEFSARIVVRGLTETPTTTTTNGDSVLSTNSQLGRCLGQFSIQDADTPALNGPIIAVLRSNRTHLAQDTNFVLANVKTRDSIYNRNHNHKNEMFYEFDVHGDNMTSGRGRGLISSSSSPTNEIFELFVNVDLDAEVQNIFEYVIELRDSGRPISIRSFVQLIVYVDDVNDNFPKFRKPFYNFSIDEWNELDAKNESDEMTTGVCMGKVEAIDNDVSVENSAIRYSLNEIRPKLRRNTGLDDDLVQNFYIDSKTGHVCVRNRRLLDREKKSKYELEIRASNKNASIYSTVSCFIVIRDLNDNRPEFHKREYKFFVPEKDFNMVNALFISSNNENEDKNEDGEWERGKESTSPMLSRGAKPIGTVRAIDRDSYSDLFYYLDSSSDDYKAYFELNTANLGDKMSDGDETGDLNSVFGQTSSSLSSQEIRGASDELMSADASSNDDFKIYDLADDTKFSESTVYEVVAIKHHQSGSSSSSERVDVDRKSTNTSEYVFSYSSDAKKDKKLIAKKVIK